jgi:hypothetical protein
MVPSVYPTGVTIFNPQKCWTGYTVFTLSLSQKSDPWSVLVDMNGNIVNRWHKLFGMPSKILPGGYIMGNTGIRDRKYGFQDMIDLVQVDWKGNITWMFKTATN